MTELKKPVKRVSGAYIKWDKGRLRPLVVTIIPPGLIRLRAQGCRRSYDLPLETVYHMAVRAAVERARKEKAKKRAKR